MVSERTTTWLAAMLAMVCSAMACGGSDEQGAAGSPCKLNEPVSCVCPGGGSGEALCQANGAIGLCQGCPASTASPVTGTAGTSVTPSAAGVGSGGAAAISGSSGSLATPIIAGAPAVPPPPVATGASGMLAPPPTAAGAPGAAGSAAATSGCAPGEMCKASPLGGVKFCSADPAAGLPPTCTTANGACGTNGKGLCIDAASVGFAGMMFCVYTAC